MSLIERLTAGIRREGPLTFPEYMAAALYDPQEGYYAKGAAQVGKAGDFFTSVSTGPVFGRLLAERIMAWRRTLAPGQPWRVVELGAHDGSLARDILEGLRELGEAEARYEILEPLPALAAAQRENLEGWNAAVFQNAEELEPAATYLLANEVLDALPCQIIESSGQGWQEMGVGLEGDRLAWTALGEIETGLPPRPAGYRTEMRPGLKECFAPLQRLLAPGRMLWIDYGFSRSIYYDESRTNGTLRTYQRHRAGEDPLAAPGEQDITAHVDFTAAAVALRELGGRITLFEDQGRCLTRLAHPWLLAREGRMDAAVRKELLAFQTLVHPGHLGSRFHLLEADFRGDSPEDGEALRRLELS